jgi:hypothetical protein
VDEFIPQAWFFAVAGFIGFIGGLALFARGLVAYRRDRLVSSIATSSLEGIAAGEVRVTGVVEAISSTLISPLQSKPCVWYRARVEETGENGRVLLNEEKAQEFMLDDGSGKIRVIPRGARWEIETVFDESTGMTGEEPIGLQRRIGSAYGALPDVEPAEMSSAEREVAVQALLTVRPVAELAAEGWSVSGGTFSSALDFGSAGRGRQYKEARLELGETITIIGQALPWSDIKRVLHAWDPSSNVESTIAADIAASRAAGILASSPEEAWGNAAIPGFGVGMPTETPDLHPDAHEPEVADPDTRDDFNERHDIPDEALVVSRGQRGEMAIYKGAPQEATMHHDSAFALGVMGALLTVFCALLLGAMISGSF